MAVKKSAGLRGRSRRGMGPGKRGKPQGIRESIGRGKRPAPTSPGGSTPYTPPAPEVAGEATVSYDPATQAAPEVPGFENQDGATWAGVPLQTDFTDPFTKTDEQDSILMGGMGEGTSPGPTTPPTTYGRPSKPPKPAKRGTPGPAAKQKKLLKRVARTTGTSVGEARGVLRKARTQVRSGNRTAAKRTITRALAGGPKAGVKSTPQRAAKAQKAATKITRRIAQRQSAAPKRKKK